MPIKEAASGFGYPLPYTSYDDETPERWADKNSREPLSAPEPDEVVFDFGYKRLWLKPQNGQLVVSRIEIYAVVTGLNATQVEEEMREVLKEWGFDDYIVVLKPKGIELYL